MSGIFACIYILEGDHFSFLDADADPTMNECMDWLPESPPTSADGGIICGRLLPTLGHFIQAYYQ